MIHLMYTVQSLYTVQAIKLVEDFPKCVKPKQLCFSIYSIVYCSKVVPGVVLECTWSVPGKYSGKSKFSIPGTVGGGSTSRSTKTVPGTKDYRLRTGYR